MLAIGLRLGGNLAPSPFDGLVDLGGQPVAAEHSEVLDSHGHDTVLLVAVHPIAGGGEGGRVACRW